MAEATIDELQIEISTSSGSAANNLDDLAKSLDRLQAVTSRITSGSDGLNKVAKQIEKLNAISQKIQSMHGFEKLGKMVNQLSKLDRLSRVGDISGFVRNANRLPQAVNALAQMPSVDATKFQQLADALKPLQSVNSSGINSLMNALRKLPKVSQELAGVDFTRLTQQIEQISRAIEPLARQAERSGQGLTAIAQIMQQTNRTARQSTDGVSLFNRAVGDIKVKTLAAVAALRRLFSALKSGVTASAAYVENLNLFSVTMGDSADEALRFAESVNSALGVDTSDWIRYQGVFQSIGKGFGIISEKADVMSKNLTQLTYDVSSFYNISVDTAAMKLQSAMSGQVMPMRELGFAIEETTLKQVALNHGIEMSVENMTQAQKAQLRYIAIMEQAGNIGVLGDMARTIDTASNGMRVFQARIQQFSRAVGNMLMPILSTALPYMTAFVQVLTEGAQAIANFFGFELPKIDFSDAQVSSGFDDITGAIDEATEANEKFKGSLASIDQLNIIGSDSESKNAANMGNQFDLGLNLPEYDFLQGVESKTKQIADNIKDWFKEALPWIEAVGTAIAGFTVGIGLTKFVGILSSLPAILAGVSPKISPFALALAGGAASGMLFYNSIKNTIKGTGSLKNNIAQLTTGISLLTITMGGFIAFGNPIGAIVTGVVALTGAVLGLEQGQKELNKQISDSIVFADNGGISIQGLTDGFSGYFSEISGHYDDILSNTKAFEDNQEKINAAAGTIDDLTKKYSLLGDEITPEDADTIATSIETIGDSIKNNLGSFTQTTVDNLKTTFHEFAEQLGLDVGDMATKFYLLENMGNSALAETRKQADELVASLKVGGLSVEEQEAKMNELKKTVEQMGVVDIGTKEEYSFFEALKSMSAADINLADQPTLISNINDLKSQGEAAKAAIDETKLSYLYELDAMKKQYEKMINPDTGNTVKKDFEDIFGIGTFDTLFADTRLAAEQTFEADKLKIDAGISAYIGMITNKLDKEISSSSSATDLTVFEALGGTFSAYGKAFGDLFTKGEFNFDPFGEQSKLHDSNIANQYKDVFSAMGEAVSGIDSGLVEAGRQGAADLLQGMLDGIISSPTDLGAALNGLGENSMTGIANGIESGSGSVIKAVDNVAIKGIDTWKDRTKTRSPSLVYTELGDYAMQGLANGITRSQDLVFSALDYTAVQSIMKLSKLKENMSAFKLGDIDTKSLIPDFSFKAPTISRAAFEQPTGTVREAYAQATQSAPYGYNNTDGMTATIELYNYLEMDGDIIAEKVETRRVDMQRRMNGR